MAWTCGIWVLKRVRRATSIAKTGLESWRFVVETPPP